MILFLFLTLAFLSCDTQVETEKNSDYLVISGTIPDHDTKGEPAEKTADVKTKPKAEPEAEPVEPAPAPAEEEAIVNTEEMNRQLQADRYDATGKIDPFSPLIRAEAETEKDKKVKPDRILTPLEKLDLSQMRLTAVISNMSKKLALVEESSGKGYMVDVGTYIGRNGGRVHKIENDSIIIKETTENFKGELTEQYHEMKLHKQENGD
jgi:type IV pilus assembly protein PilP